MCTRAAGRKIAEIYTKYEDEQEVSSEDMQYLRILMDAARVVCSFRDGKLYARSV